MEFGGFFWITIVSMNDLVKPSQTQSNPDMPTHRADASGLPDGADAGREARPAAREGACAPRNQPVGLRFESKQDPNGDAYVSAKAEIAPGRANQIKSNQIKPVRGKYLWHTELHGGKMEFGGFFWITIMNDLVKPVKLSQTPSNPDMPTHRADASGLPDGADAGREARPAAREGACAPRNQPVELRFEPKQDHPNGDAYVSAKAEIALGRANQTKSNQIKPAGFKNCKSSGFNAQNSRLKTPPYAEKAKHG
jgi:hypothetical protein